MGDDCIIKVQVYYEIYDTIYSDFFKFSVDINAQFHAGLICINPMEIFKVLIKATRIPLYCVYQIHKTTSKVCIIKQEQRSTWK